MKKVVINLTVGPEDEEASTIAYLVATAAQDSGKDVLFFMTKEAVRLGFKGGADGVQDEGRPSLAGLSQQFADHGGTVYLCPVCVRSRHLDEATLLSNAAVLGAAALWAWVGDGATTFTY